MSRFSLFNETFLTNHAPATESGLWLLARAVTGDANSLLLIVGGSFTFFALATYTGAVQFRKIVVAALGVADGAHRQKRRQRMFVMRSVNGALVHKELKLIGRDPWLISQTLMQVLYLLPPAFMLWISFGTETQVSVIVAPVIVMAVGQLAGGLAWLTISGEDAPDLIATAPVSNNAILWAKVKAVLIIVAALIAPMALALASVSAWGAVVTFAGAMTAASCAILVQLWFRSQAKRTMFRRRQVASKVSTFAEAAASILCAGTTALVAASQPFAIIPALLLAFIMGLTRHLAKGSRSSRPHAIA